MSVQSDKRVLQALIRELPDVVDDWWLGVGLTIETDIKTSMSEYGPSAPGEPPAVDTGRLRASLHTRHIGRFRVRIQDGTLYGLLLERGTSRMAARPFFAPVFIAWRQRKLRQEVQKLRARIENIR